MKNRVRRGPRPPASEFREVDLAKSSGILFIKNNFENGIIPIKLLLETVDF